MIYQTPPIGPEEEHALAEIAQLRSPLRYYVTEPRRWVGSVRRGLSARAIQGSNWRPSRGAVAVAGHDEGASARSCDAEELQGDVQGAPAT
ncbi:hypothetical protein BH20ACT5_BH20ACT5_07530 [soil metagenome]